MDRLGLVDDDDLHSLGAPSTRSNGNGNNSGHDRTLSLSARGRHLDKQVDDDVRALAKQMSVTPSSAATIS